MTEWLSSTLHWLSSNSHHVSMLLLSAFLLTLTVIYYINSIGLAPISLRRNVIGTVLTTFLIWIWTLLTCTEPTFYLLGFFAIYFLIYLVVYRLNWRNAAFHMLIYYFSGGYIGRILGWVYRSLGGRQYTYNGSPMWDEPTIFMLSGLLVSIVIFYLRPYIRKIAGYTLKTYEILPILVIAAPIVYFCYSPTFLSVSFVSMPLDVILIRAVISMSTAIAMISMVLTRKQQAELADLRLLEVKLEEQYQRHLLKAQGSELIMQKYHDLEKHLRYFQENPTAGALNQYQAELQNTIAVFESVFETGNATLDAVLSEAYRKCQTAGITLVCMADGRLIDFMDAIDIYTIFENALDNAIESVEEISAAEKRIIHVKIYQKQLLLLIQFENYYEDHLAWEDGRLKTIKADPQNHGFGLKSIEYTVKKYQGSIKVTPGEDRFTLTILIHREDHRPDKGKAPAYGSPAHI
jgi:hypothetical protein